MRALVDLDELRLSRIYKSLTLRFRRIGPIMTTESVNTVEGSHQVAVMMTCPRSRLERSRVAADAFACWVSAVCVKG